jgi:predicted aspartyl protease
LSGNTGTVVVGGSTVVASLSTRTGVPLDAGDTLAIDSADLSHFYIDSTVNGEGVSFLYLT